MDTLFSRSIDTLPSVMSTLKTFCRNERVPGAVEFVVTFAVEELFTNMVKYNPNGPPDVRMTTDLVNGSIVIRLEDEQEHHFDPTQAPDPDLHKHMSERRPGGLGLFLVRKMVDKVEYLRDGRKSVITLTHSVSHTDV